MEAVRIIKEMRRATNGEYPRFALWENVPGAFSSNKGEDFRIVCEELIKIVEPTASMPPVPQNGWAYADSYIGDGWSLSYRVFDAQYWGVPQRRRRIHLVADFRGERAGEVLFEREGLRGYFAEGGTPWQTAPADAQGSTGADDSTGEMGARATDRGSDGSGRGGLLNPSSPGYSDGLLGGRQLDDVGIINTIGGNAENYHVGGPLPTLANGTVPGYHNAVAYSFDSLASNSMKSSNPHSGCREVEVSKTLDTTDPNPSKNQGGIAVVQPIPYTMKVRSGCDVDSSGKAAGKGALIQENKAATLSTVQDQYLFQPVTDTHIIDNVGGQAEYAKASAVNGTLRAGCQGLVAYAVENHPADSRVNLDESGKVQTLTSRMGTGGGNVPMVMEEHPVICMATQQGGAEIRTDDKAPTLTAAAGMSGNNQPVICLQGNGIDRADTAGCNGKGWKEDTAYTLNTIDRPAVAYGLDRASFNQGQNAKFDFSVSEEQQPTLTARGPGAVCCTTGSYMQVTEEVSPTLMARDWKDPTCVSTNYIVRRLTPTECARLQGFADWWSVVEPKYTLTDEEYTFWCDVYLTKQIIDGKVEYDENGNPRYVSSKRPFIHKPLKQMLAWHNKLWTDSAEYKMWGNGIALPTALYVLQGLTDALNTEEDLDDWMN